MIRLIFPSLLGVTVIFIFQIFVLLGLLASYGMAADTLTEMSSDMLEPFAWALVGREDNIVQSGSSRVVTCWLCQYPVWRP